MSERICVFGGTFDPIHLAHLRIAEEAKDKFALDRVLFVPAGNPPHKDVFTSFEDRFEMVDIACAPCPGFEASRLEAGAEQSYTIDTMRRFKQTVPPQAKLFFLIGADAFDELETWKGWTELVELTDFIVVARPETTYRVADGAHVQRLDGMALQISSSSIRSRLAEGEPTPELPDEVRAYIEKHGLYGFGKAKLTA